MAKLIYSAITSLDGFVADEQGNFEWGVPSDEVHSYINDLERAIGTYLYGRRMYEVMRAWETLKFSGQPRVVRDYARIWRASEKVIYSRTLESVAAPRTRLEHEFDVEAVRALKASAEQDLAIGGPELAAQALRAGLVDEVNFIVSPVSIGAGNPALPEDDRVDLELLDEHPFANRVVHRHYRVK